MKQITPCYYRLPRSMAFLGAWLLMAPLFLACNQERDSSLDWNAEGKRGFYFWKNNSTYLVNKEQKALKELMVGRLYVKMFEVEANAVFGPVPTAKSALQINTYTDSSLRSVELVPTVYIRNEVLKGISANGIDSLASNIFFLIDKHCSERFEGLLEPYQEIQLDCDWTTATQEAYFSLIKALRATAGKRVSCTLRLYPYRYPDKMGVPPADRAMLMCYNLISPLADASKNSVLDLGELEAYLKGADGVYPLPLDIALPIFSLVQVHRNGQFMGLINLSEKVRAACLRPKKDHPLWYEVTKDVEVGDAYLRQGDAVKIEEVAPEALSEAVALLQKHLTLENAPHVAFFHLDNIHLDRYTHETLLRYYTDWAL